ncbi:hypothetical protein K2F43_17070 [Clostridium estertheticum]|uniref:hypothetical protein n=1 Tax=Clostridium estertheticum TaxID=238834 RepID=UPI001C6E8A56|nr:hypothetical protein [Clostridium estertheticum]MBW9172919.1 hypothetical protein [Clostridium estertheticum]WLC75241.1 hypothetical protein KTC99_21430 [Clostridium estertheticum]
MDSENMKCSECGEIIIDKNTVCPKCGSNKKTISMFFFEDLRGLMHNRLSGKVKKKGIKKPTEEFIYGDEKCVSNNTWVDKTRIIDRVNNEYTEIVKNNETGEIIHECQESLKDHYDHGSAKVKKK